MLVPVASRSPYPSQMISRGTITLPPPTPSRPLSTPAAVPIAASFRVLGMAGDTRGPMGPGIEQLERLVAPLRRDPGHSAVLTDVDGTIAPIVLDPKDATVPERTREILRALARRYALVGCLSGRRAMDARRVVGL